MKSSQVKGYLYTFLAYFIWGILPIYWKEIKHVPPLEVLVHRILWTLVILLIINLFFYRTYIYETFRKNKNLNILLFLHY